MEKHEPVKILFVDDELNVLKALRRFFFDEDNYELLTAQSGAEGLAVVKENPDILLIVSDYRMPGMTGVEFLAEATKLLPQSIRIVLSGFADTAAVVEAINVGHIYKFIPKPWDDDQLRIDLHNAVQTALLEKKNRQLAQELEFRNHELENLNTSLEKEVEKRTEALKLRSGVLQLAQDILDSLPIAILGIDPDDMIVQINEYANTLLGGKEQIVLGQNSDILPTDLLALIEQVKIGGVAHGEIVCDSQDVKAFGVYINNDRNRGIIISLVPQ